jgi:hypothetical protein
VRSQPTLTRGEIDRLVAVYLDDLAKRDQEYPSWLPRGPLTQRNIVKVSARRSAL